MLNLDVLNPQQRKAVEHGEGPLLVLAGAGSGKTRVLTYRIARLIESGVPAWSILAITFTNKAAREMQERIAKISGSAAEEAWVSTFHSCCARILRRDIEKLGYKRSFVIYDDDDQMTVLKRIVKEMNLNDKIYAPRMIKSIISDAKNRLLNPKEWLQEAGDDQRNRKIYEVICKYEAELRSNNALDFDDMIVKTLELLSENPPVLEYYRRKFRHVLVDEYQDTNMAQYQLVCLLSAESRNLCVVGDDDQSIYGWRGADLRNILEFEKDFPDCVTVKLEQNYRSTGNILDAANQVIAHNTGRKEKKLWTEMGEGQPIVLYHAADEREEAAWIVQNMVDLQKKGMSVGDMAVLYRTNAQSRVLEEALVRRGIPYRVYGGMKFYDRKEIKDLLAYMRLCINPEDDVALRRIINEPKRAIGPTTVDELAQFAAENEMPMLTAVLSAEDAPLKARAKAAVMQFGDMMIDLTEKAMELSAPEFLKHLLEVTGYQAQFEVNKTDENIARIENIHEFEGAVREYAEQNPEEGLVGFLENVSLVTDLDSMEEKQETVTLMTIHSAKGLEFPAVFLCGMEENIFPIARAVFDDDQLEEERRLCYVGITRAMRRLFMSHARTRMLFNNRQANEISRFIGEIPARLISDARRQQQPTRIPAPQTRRESAPIGGGYGSYAGGGRTTSGGTNPGFGRSISFGSDGKLNIPGVQKGFASGAPRTVQSAAAGMAPATLFKQGNRIRHRIFGEGEIIEVRPGKDGDRLVIRFGDGQEKIFPANTAPIVRID